MEKQVPKISVITVVKNDAEGFRMTADSILQQDYKNIEFIVIDGGSDDGTAGAIREYEGRITFWSSEPDMGTYDGMNRGLARATGDWVSFLNAGDRYYSEQTVSKVAATGLEGYDVVYGDVIAQYPVGQRFKRAGSPVKIKYGMPCCHQSVFIRRMNIPATGFTLAWKIGADYDMLLSLFVSGARFQRLSLPVAVFDASGMSNRNMVESASEHKAIARKHLAMTPWLNFYHDLYIRWVKLVMFGYRLVPRGLLKHLRGL